MSAHLRVAFWVGLILALNWISLMFVQPRATIELGYFVGTLSANATLAAAWAALGPGPLIWRLPLSIGWIILQLIVVAINISAHSGPHNAVFVIGILLGVQWLFLQVPLWALNLGAGLQLRYRNEMDVESDSDRVRFGIRDLFILMAVVGVLLGLGRVVVPYVDMSGGQEVYIFVFLGIAGVIMTFPLLVAALMQRMVLPGIAAAVVFIAAATFAEWPLFEQLGGPGPDIEDFVTINTAAGLMVLVVAGVVRLNGYSLQRVLPSAGFVTPS